MNTSRAAGRFTLAFVIGSIWLLGPLALDSNALYSTGCVVQEPCEPNPPPGMYCDVEFPDAGSQPQAGGGAASLDPCAYVYTSSGPAQACGAYVPESFIGPPVGDSCQ